MTTSTDVSPATVTDLTAIATTEGAHKERRAPVRKRRSRCLAWGTHYARDVYQPPRLRTPVPADVLTMAETARDGKLVLCVGAGVSVSQDAGLPSGAELGELLDSALDKLLEDYVSPGDVANLIAVADAAVVPVGGERALQGIVLGLARFKTAVPNYGHQVIALLLAEGAVTGLSWNWDTCIERSAPEGEVLEVAATRDAMDLLDRPNMAKVHGCASMRRSLLVTSQQLSYKMPVWAQEAFSSRLRTSRMVFVGIGDVADYAQRRIKELLDAFGSVDITVVGRSIRDKWDESIWAQLLPTLEESGGVVQRESDEFFDQLARAWAIKLLQSVETDAANAQQDVQGGVNRVTRALGELSAVDAITWCRRAFYGLRTGDSAITRIDTGNALFAAGVLAAQHGAEVRMPRAACCALNDEYIEVLIVPQRTWPPEIQREARRRTEELASNDHRIGEEVVFLVGGNGVMGDLPDSEEWEWDMVSGEVASQADDVLDGPTVVRPRYLRESTLRQAA